MTLANLGIAVPVYIAGPTDPRIHYFRRMLAALKAASRSWPIYFFVDGGAIDLTCQLIRSFRFHNAEVIVNPVNIGLGLNLIKARRFCFERMKHDYVFVCESDVVIYQDLIPLLYRVMKWSDRTQGGPSVASSAILRYSHDPKHVASHMMNWTNYLMPVKAWNVIAPYIAEFEAFLKGVPYSSRPHQAIVDWQMQRFNRPNQGTCQDNINTVACHALGVSHWTLCRNRAVHIGEHGVNNNPEVNAKFGWTKQEMGGTEDDLKFTEFEPYGIKNPDSAVDSPEGSYISGKPVGSFQTNASV